MNDPVEVHLATGRKCRRCRLFRVEVGSHPIYADLCLRCGDAVETYDREYGIEIEPHPTASPQRLAPDPERWEAVGPYLKRQAKEIDAAEVVYAYDWDRQEALSRRYWAAQGMER